MITYYIALRRPGSLWNPDKQVREQPFWDEHARFMDSLFATGMVILAGPFADRTGALLILRAENAAQVHDVFQQDPWTKHDVSVVSEIKEWTIFLDARDS